jgi:hypothetical protein
MSLESTLRSVTFGFMIVSLVTVLFLISPILIPVVTMLHRRDQRRMLTAACNTHCSQCGAILGVASITRADATWAEHVAALEHERPTIRFRMVRRIWAICAECDSQYGFDTNLRAFDLVP